MIIKLSAVYYYISSLPKILLGINFWIIPLVFVYSPALLKLRNGLKFYVRDLMDIWVIKELILDRQYEFFNDANKNWTVIDIGSGIGEFDILLSPKVKRIYAFDLDKNRNFLARKNFEINNSSNIRLLEYGVQDLNKEFRKYKIKKCNLLKIDCEGCEYQIFKNISKTTLSKIDKIVMECHLFNNLMRESFKKMINLLKNNGFELLIKDNPVHESLKFLYAYKK